MSDVKSDTGTPQTLSMTVDASDPGDETASRYRYQWTYAAILCCSLLDDTREITEVFCEHFEDVVLRHSDGLFSGYQIKTRSTDQLVWKASDPQLFDAFKRFVRLDNEHPSEFKGFYFLTNHPLHRADNGKSITGILRKIKDSSCLSDVDSKYAKFINKLATRTNFTREQVFKSLKKTDATDNLPKIEDVTKRLQSTLACCWEQASDCSLSDLLRVCTVLIEECARASSLDHRNTLPGYIGVLFDSDDVEILARVQGKLIDKERLLDILKKGFDGVFPLHIDPALLVEPGEGQISLLEKKLDAGGFSAISINSAKDLRDRSDYYGLQLKEKNGHVKGLQKYGELRSLVLRDAAQAFETTKKDTPFGIEMLQRLRESFEELLEEEPELHGCKKQHLEGLAFSLTSQCKIQWSINRPWEEE